MATRRYDFNTTIESDTIATPTDALQLPVGTTAQRPTATVGMIRYNSTSSKFEVYNGSTWIDTFTASLSAGIIDDEAYFTSGAAATSSAYGVVTGGEVPALVSGSTVSSNKIGQVLTWQKDTNTNASNNAWVNLQSGTLQAGLWMATGALRVIRNGSAFTTFDARFGFNHVDGNTGTPGASMVEGYNLQYFISSNSSDGYTLSDATIALPPTLIRYDGTTVTLENGTTFTPTSGTIYLKFFMSGISSGTPVCRGRMIMWRIG